MILHIYGRCNSARLASTTERVNNVETVDFSRYLRWHYLVGWNFACTVEVIHAMKQMQLKICIALRLRKWEWSHWDHNVCDESLSIMIKNMRLGLSNVAGMPWAIVLRHEPRKTLSYCQCLVSNLPLYLGFQWKIASKQNRCRPLSRT